MARAVPAGRAAAWYSAAMAMFRRAPLAWAGLGAATLAIQLALQIVPSIGLLLDKVLMPLVAAGLLVAADAVARGERPSLRHLLAPLAAPAAAQIAIVVSGVLAFAIEAIAVDSISGINLLSAEDLRGAAVDPAVLLVGSAIGIAASLPLTFVPTIVLFDRGGIVDSFAASFRGFARNPLPMLTYAAIGLALIAVGVVTLVALVVVYPLWAAATYVAWRDIYE